MNQLEASWLAGFLDGEGSFMILQAPRSGYMAYEARISVSSADFVLVEYCKKIANGYLSKPFQPTSNNGNARKAKIWYLKARKLDNVLTSILPFLILKKEQAQILLVLRNEMTHGAAPGHWGRSTSPERNQRRELMRFAVKALNHRGTTPIPSEYSEALIYVRANILSRV